MAGYDDTRSKILNTLLQRENGTLITPEKHQDFALNLLEYIRSVELISASTLIGVANADTVPVQPNDSNASYIAGVGAGREVEFKNFRNISGKSIIINTEDDEVKLVILLWNKQCWEAFEIDTAVIDLADVEKALETSNGALETAKEAKESSEQAKTAAESSAEASNEALEKVKLISDNIIVSFAGIISTGNNDRFDNVEIKDDFVSISEVELLSRVFWHSKIKKFVVLSTSGSPAFFTTNFSFVNRYMDSARNYPLYKFYKNMIGIYFINQEGDLSLLDTPEATDEEIIDLLSTLK